MRSVWRVVNEFDKDDQIVSPKKRNTPKPFPKVDGFDLNAIRKIVHDFIKQMNLLHSRKSMLP